MLLGYICKIQKLLGKTQVLLEKYTPSFLLRKEGNIGLMQTLRVTGKLSLLWGQSPEDLNFVHSFLPANREPGNINT